MPSHADRVRRHYVDAALAGDATGSTLHDWLGLVRAEADGKYIRTPQGDLSNEAASS